MKKLLLATAAVMALSASAAQAEIKLDLGGYFKGYAGYANQDTAGLREFDIKRKSQIYFDGETTLDNGLTVGYHGELYQENNDVEATGLGVQDGFSQLEESYLYFSGNWGRFNLGRSNGAAYLLQVAAPGADSNIDGQDISISFYNPTGNYHQDYKQAGIETNTGFGNSIAASQYADKITYLTPKFNGFQAGVSYSPQVDQKTVNNNVAGSQSDALGFEDAFDIAARYDGEFSGVGVHVGGGYSFAGQETDTLANDDYKEWNAGLKLTFEGFGIGGAYNTDNGALDSSGDTDNWTVGVDYTWGAYVFGASYFDSQADSDDSELQRYAVGATYTFGPGMQFRGAVAYYNDDAPGAAADNDATVVTIGTDIQF